MNALASESSPIAGGQEVHMELQPDVTDTTDAPSSPNEPQLDAKTEDAMVNETTQNPEDCAADPEDYATEVGDVSASETQNVDVANDVTMEDPNKEVIEPNKPVTADIAVPEDDVPGADSIDPIDAIDETPSPTTNVMTESHINTALIAIDTERLETHTESDRDETEIVPSNEEIEAGHKIDIQDNPSSHDLESSDTTQNDVTTPDNASSDADTATVVKSPPGSLETEVSETHVLEIESNSSIPQSDTPDDVHSSVLQTPNSSNKDIETPDGMLAPKTRKSSANLTTPVRSEKPVSEKKHPGGISSAKKAEISSTAESSSNRLRRSVRIRQTSSDKDAGAKKKK